jgi:hypothetical protein
VADATVELSNRNFVIPLIDVQFGRIHQWLVGQRNT